MANTTWTGKLTLIKTVNFTRKAGKWGTSFVGRADVYSFEPDDKKCKVTFAATFTGIPPQVAASNGGYITDAILEQAGLSRVAKNSGINGTYDSFPDPIGCPAERIGEHAAVQSITFYRK